MTPILLILRPKGNIYGSTLNLPGFMAIDNSYGVRARKVHGFGPARPQKAWA